MRNCIFLTLLISILLLLSPAILAQEDTVAPGIQVRSLLLTEVEAGKDLTSASSEVSETVLENELYFSPAGLVYLQQNREPYQNMVTLLNENASAFEITVAGLASMSETPSEVVTIAMIFFPESADEIYSIALQMGVINEDDALLAAINAGIDPTTLTATAAGAGDAPLLPTPTDDTAPAGGGVTISAN